MNQPIIGIKFEDDRLASPLNTLRDHYDVIVYSTRFLVHCQLTFRYEAEKLVQFSLNQLFKENLVYWIVDCVFGSNIAYILNSRNEVLLYDLSQQKTLARHFGTQKCILYSGKFLQCSHSGLIIASGTVFKTILLWSLKIDDNKRCLLKDIQALYGHDGVIFGIDYNLHYNILISASDDRSVRIWNSDLTTASESSLLDMEFWENNNKFKLAHVHYGHSARIWKVSSLSLNLPIAISAGEDSSIFLWSLVPPYTCLQKKLLARGTRIWSFEILPKHVAFGGSDSAVKIISINDLLSCKEFSLNQTKLSIDSLKAVCYLLHSQQQNILCATKGGKFYTVSNNGACKNVQFAHCQLIDCFEDVFSDYICMKNNPHQTKAVIASKYGHLCLLKVDEDEQIRCIHTVKPFNSKILDMGFINNHQFLCLTTSQMKIFSIETNCIVENVCSFSFPNQNRRSRFTCGLLLNDLLIIGDFSGSVFAYQSCTEKPVSQFLHVHGHNGVNTLKQKPLSQYVYSCGRNGRILEYLVVDSPEKGTYLNLLRTFAILPIEWIADFQFDNQAPFNLKYAYGFAFGSNFLFWNLPENRSILEDECGGGHRSWDLAIGSSEGKPNLNMSYVKQNNLIILKWQLPLFCEQSLGTASFLPRHINCCAHLYTSLKSHFFLTAGEDNVIQAIHFHRDNGTILPCATLYGHISNITSIKCFYVEAEQPTIYAVSCGGRSQFIVWKFIISDNEELICQEQVSNFSGTFSDHIAASNYTRKANKASDSSKKKFETDIRYLNVDLCQTKSPDEFLILIACSDSSFRLFWYNDTERRITKSERVSIGRISCVLKTNLIHQLSSVRTLCAFATTDGCLSLWPLGDATESIQSWQLHQAGINGIDFRFVNSKFFTHFKVISLSEFYIVRYIVHAHWW